MERFHATGYLPEGRPSDSISQRYIKFVAKPSGAESVTRMAMMMWFQTYATSMDPEDGQDDGQISRTCQVGK